MCIRDSLVIGSGFAAFIFSISVVAVPLMLDRDKDTISAMLLSLATVAKNPLPMLLWAALIVTPVSYTHLDVYKRQP